MSQDQFLEVIDRDEAERRFRAAVDCRALAAEEVGLDEALGRVTAADVVAGVDVPSFDRSNYDGYAVRAADTYGAGEEHARRLRLLDEAIATGTAPAMEVVAGSATTIATGGMLPRGADSVVMVEHTDVEGPWLVVRRATTPGHGVSFAGTDIAAGETVLRRGESITSRETGVLAAIGTTRVSVWRRPRVAIVSTGDELVEPGQPMRAGLVYDSNGQILADAVRELGGLPLRLGIVRDDLPSLRALLQRALEASDLVLLSGGTSKGAGDLSYRAVRELTEPGIVAHGVALKPGKPICLAAQRGKGVVVLPGFPTSAIFTFHEFVAPLVRSLGGRGAQVAPTLAARTAVKINSEIGRTEYVLVGLVEGEGPGGPGESGPGGGAEERPSLWAYPMGKGSGSVTTFSRADGFVTIGRHEEIVEAGTLLRVQLLGDGLRRADLVAIGSHCVGLDYLLGLLQDQGFHTKFMAVGSTGGLEAARRGECDLAGIHLFDPQSGQYNEPFLSAGLRLVRGYGRLQGIVFRAGDARFARLSAEKAVRAAVADPQCAMVNRNAGSGTRILIDRLLAGARPPGYWVQAKSHNAVTAAVAQGRADWGVAIRGAAQRAHLGFLELEVEQYDFVVPQSRWKRPAVQAFCDLLADPAVRRSLQSLGFVGMEGETKARNR